MHLNHLLKMLISKLRIIEGIVARALVRFLPDDIYIKMAFHSRVGYYPNLNNPKTYNEKLQWLKLNYHRAEYSAMVDKITAKEYVRSIIGEEYIINTIGTWDNVDDVDWDSLPMQFVIKVTSDSGGIVVCKDKSQLDIAKAVSKLKKGWGQNYYKYNKEYPYRGVVPRILAEEYIECEDDGELKDYKFFCFDGEPKFLFVASDRQNPDQETKFDFFDLGWNHLPVINGHPNSDQTPYKPERFDEMVDIAAKLSQGMPHVRVDLYNIKGKIYFGELTFFHWSGMMAFSPLEWDYRFGEYINLPAKVRY